MNPEISREETPIFRSKIKDLINKFERLNDKNEVESKCKVKPGPTTNETKSRSKLSCTTYSKEHQCTSKASKEQTYSFNKCKDNNSKPLEENSLRKIPQKVAESSKYRSQTTHHPDGKCSSPHYGRTTVDISPDEVNSTRVETIRKSITKCGHSDNQSKTLEREVSTDVTDQTKRQSPPQQNSFEVRQLHDLNRGNISLEVHYKHTGTNVSKENNKTLLISDAKKQTAHENAHENEGCTSVTVEKVNENFLKVKVTEHAGKKYSPRKSVMESKSENYTKGSSSQKECMPLAESKSSTSTRKIVRRLLPYVATTQKEIIKEKVVQKGVKCNEERRIGKLVNSSSGFKHGNVFAEECPKRHLVIPLTNANLRPLSQKLLNSRTFVKESNDFLCKRELRIEKAEKPYAQSTFDVNGSERNLIESSVSYKVKSEASTSDFASRCSFQPKEQAKAFLPGQKTTRNIEQIFEDLRDSNPEFKDELLRVHTTKKDRSTLPENSTFQSKMFIPGTSNLEEEPGFTHPRIVQLKLKPTKQVDDREERDTGSSIKLHRCSSQINVRNPRYQKTERTCNNLSMVEEGEFVPASSAKGSALYLRPGISDDSFSVTHSSQSDKVKGDDLPPKVSKKLFPVTTCSEPNVGHGISNSGRGIHWNIEKMTLFVEDSFLLRSLKEDWLNCIDAGENLDIHVVPYLLPLLSSWCSHRKMSMESIVRCRSLKDYKAALLFPAALRSGTREKHLLAKVASFAHVPPDKILIVTHHFK